MEVEHNLKTKLLIDVMRREAYFREQESIYYNKDLLFQYNKELADDDLSPVVMEIGFLTYFIMRSMEAHFMLKKEKEPAFNNLLLDVLPKEDEAKP